MLAAKTAMDDAKRSGFWKMWAMSANLAAIAKKNFKQDDIIKQLEAIGTIEADIVVAEKLVGKRTNMHETFIAA